MSAWNGDHMLPVAPYRALVREAWRTHTLGELSAMTGLGPSTLRKIMFGQTGSIQVRTAVKLKALQSPEEP